MHTKQAVMLTLSPEIRFTQQRITLTAQNIGQLSAYEQWGVGAPYSEGYSVTTLPISFSNADFALMITNANLYAGTFISGAPISKTQVKIWNDTYSDAYNFFAVGYQRSGEKLQEMGLGHVLLQCLLIPTAQKGS